MRFSRAKPVGSFRVFQRGSRSVASHGETLQDARKSAAYWASAVSSPMEIQERFPSGEWVTVEVVQPKSSRAHAKRSHATVKTAEWRTREHPRHDLGWRMRVFNTHHAAQGFLNSIKKRHVAVIETHGPSQWRVAYLPEGEGMPLNR